MAVNVVRSGMPASKASWKASVLLQENMKTRLRIADCKPRGFNKARRQLRYEFTPRSAT